MVGSSSIILLSPWVLPMSSFEAAKKLSSDFKNYTPNASLFMSVTRVLFASNHAVGETQADLEMASPYPLPEFARFYFSFQEGL